MSEGRAKAGDTKACDTRAAYLTGVRNEASSPLTRATRGWLDHLRVERGAADNTLTSYRRDLARYDQFLTARGISDPTAVRESDVTDFLAWLCEGAPERERLSASSAARPLVAVRGFTGFSRSR